MLDKLTQIEKEFEDVNQQLMQPDVASDMEKMIKLNRRRAELEPIVELAKKFKQTAEAIKNAEEMLESESDSEMSFDDAQDLRDMARDELKSAKERMVKLEEEVKVALLPNDPNDGKNVIVEVRAGTGGEEASLFAGEVMRMLMKFAENCGFSNEIMTQSESETGGIKEASFMIKGNGAYSKFKYEGGTHRVQRIPATESQGRIHTSAITVAVLPEAEEVDIEVDPNDLKVDVFRASGCGGQSVNTTDSAVRMTHVPTGIVVSCQDEKSQLKNKIKALKILRSRLLAQREEEAAKERGDARLAQVGSGDRSEKIRTYNYPQDRVTDHRIKKSWSNLPGILAGDLEDVVSSLTVEDQAAKMAKAR
jgi:peptide chain release factor 1